MVVQKPWLAHLHRKKGLRHSRPQPGCHLPNSPWAGIIYPPKEIFVFDIPAGDGNVADLLLQCVDFLVENLQILLRGHTLSKKNGSKTYIFLGLSFFVTF